MTYRYWLQPIVRFLPPNIRQGGNILYMAFWAAFNPMMGGLYMPPFYGLIVYILTVWWLYNTNPLNMIRSPSEEVTKQNYTAWLMRAGMWGIFLSFIPLYVLYVTILFVTRSNLMVKFSGF